MKTKKQVLAELEAKAKVFREADPRLTDAQAFDKAWIANQDLRVAYRAAPDDPIEEPPQKFNEWADRPNEKRVIHLIEKKAAELQKHDPTLTDAIAFVKVLEEYPDANEKLRRAREMDRQRDQQTQTSQTATKTPFRATETQQRFRVANGSGKSFEVTVSKQLADQLEALSRSQRNTTGRG